jgi:putative membrane protein
MVKPRDRRVVLTLLIWSVDLRVALAHGGEEHLDGAIGPRNWQELSRTWGMEPGVLIPLGLSLLIYALGLRKLWRGGRVGRGVRLREALCFGGGWLSLFVALASPLHPWGSVLFSAHMTQHEILMIVAAPLLVLGRPLVASLKALPSGWARTAVRWTKAPWWNRAWGTVTNPFVAWLVHGSVLWIWHIPALFQAATDSELVHDFQHLSFLLSALLFWWAVLQGQPRAAGYGVGVLYMFTTALHSGLLGSLITVAKSLWYPAYRGTTASWGLTPLEDQQLGGLIMWIPACSVYVVAGLALFAAWIGESERRILRREARPVESASVSPLPRPQVEETVP